MTHMKDPEIMTMEGTKIDISKEINTIEIIKIQRIEIDLMKGIETIEKVSKIEAEKREGVIKDSITETELMTSTVISLIKPLKMTDSEILTLTLIKMNSIIETVIEIIEENMIILEKIMKEMRFSKSIVIIKEKIEKMKGIILRGTIGRKKMKCFLKIKIKKVKRPILKVTNRADKKV